MTTRQFTIGSGPDLPRTALLTILADLQQSNSNRFLLRSHEIRGDQLHLTYEFTPVDEEEGNEEEE